MAALPEIEICSSIGLTPYPFVTLKNSASPSFPVRYPLAVNTVPVGSEPILGVLALEGLGICVDPKTRSLQRERARSLE
jgi:hypothetical protein